MLYAQQCGTAKLRDWQRHAKCETFTAPLAEYVYDALQLAVGCTALLHTYIHWYILSVISVQILSSLYLMLCLGMFHTI